MRCSTQVDAVAIVAWGVPFDTPSNRWSDYDLRSKMSDNAPENCCKPGDITVTPIPSGFLIGRVLPSHGPGPWWEFIKIVSTPDEAFQLARDLSAAANTKAWLHRHANHYDEIEQL